MSIVTSSERAQLGRLVDQTAAAIRAAKTLERHDLEACIGALHSIRQARRPFASRCLKVAGQLALLGLGIGSTLLVGLATRPVNHQPQTYEWLCALLLTGSCLVLASIYLWEETQ